MRNKLFQQILDETPQETKIFVEKYDDLVVRINELLKEKSLSQKDFAENMGQKPSAISRWLNGSGNLTLRTIAKMEAELGEDLIQIPQADFFSSEIKTIVLKEPLPRAQKTKENLSAVVKSESMAFSFPLETGKDTQTELFKNKRDAQKQLVA